MGFSKDKCGACLTSRCPLGACLAHEMVTQVAVPMESCSINIAGKGDRLCRTLCSLASAWVLDRCRTHGAARLITQGDNVDTPPCAAKWLH